MSEVDEKMNQMRLEHYEQVHIIIISFLLMHAVFQTHVIINSMFYVVACFFP